MCSNCSANRFAIPESSGETLSPLIPELRGISSLHIKEDSVGTHYF